RVRVRVAALSGHLAAAGADLDPVLPLGLLPWSAAAADLCVTIAYVGGEFPPNEVNSVFGIYASASAVGGFLGRFVPGMLTQYVGWRGGFLALACGSLICLAMVALLLAPERKFVRATDFRTSLR